jgi:hypothetical protein
MLQSLVTHNVGKSPGLSCRVLQALEGGTRDGSVRSTPVPLKPKGKNVSELTGIATLLPVTGLGPQ